MKKLCKDCQHSIKQTTPPKCNRFPIIDLVYGDVIDHHPCHLIKYHGADGEPACGEYGRYYEPARGLQSVEDLPDLPNILRRQTG